MGGSSCLSTMVLRMQAPSRRGSSAAVFRCNAVKMASAVVQAGQGASLSLRHGALGPACAAYTRLLDAMWQAEKAVPCVWTRTIHAMDGRIPSPVSTMPPFKPPAPHSATCGHAAGDEDGAGGLGPHVEPGQPQVVGGCALVRQPPHLQRGLLEGTDVLQLRLAPAAAAGRAGHTRQA